VKFEINANGILQVSACEKMSGKERKIVIKNDNNRFSKDEINEFVLRAKSFEQDDKSMRAKIEAKMKLENYLYSVRNSISDEMKDKLGEELYCKINELVLEGLHWIEDTADLNVVDYENKYKEYNKKITPILESIYKK
jgi:molecular chaperone DnaK (HSP70)